MTIIIGGCMNCGAPVGEQAKDAPKEQKGFCPECIKKAKKLGAMAEITRRAAERKVPLSVIVDELIDYALTEQAREGDEI